MAISAFILSIFILPGKNKKEYIACFETRALAYRSFRHISYLPEIMTISWFIVKYPNGLWKLPPQCSFINLLKCFYDNNRIDKDCKLTFIEGMRATEVQEILNTEPNLSGPLIEIEEGKFFPETYFFKAGINRSVILKMGCDLMEKKLNDLFLKLNIEALKSNVMLPIDKNEFLILASIVQKEGNTYEDMLKIATCFLSRIEKGMRLQSDVTVIYGLMKYGKKIAAKNGEPFVSYKDIKIDTPYNTYIIKKLPIGPICMPGDDALNSVANALQNAITNAGNKNARDTNSGSANIESKNAAIKNKIITKKMQKLKYPEGPLYFYACNGQLLYANNLAQHNKNKFTCLLKKT